MLLFTISMRTLSILIMFGLNFRSDNSNISSTPNLVLVLDLCLLTLFLKAFDISYNFCWKLDKMYWEKETEVNSPWVWGFRFILLGFVCVYCRCQRIKFPLVSLVSLLFSLLSSLGFSRHLLNKSETCRNKQCNVVVCFYTEALMTILVRCEKGGNML